MDYTCVIHSVYYSSNMMHGVFDKQELDIPKKDSLINCHCLLAIQSIIIERTISIIYLFRLNLHFLFINYDD